MSLSKKICLSLVLLLIILFSILAYLISSNNGLSLLAHSAEKWINGLKISSISGNWHNLTIKKISYSVPGITISIGEFHFVLNFDWLHLYKLYINDFNLYDVIVNLDTCKLDLSSLRLISVSKKLISINLISMPYLLVLRHLVLHNIQININSTHIILNRFSTGIQYQNNNLIVTPTHISGLLIILSMNTQYLIDKTIKLLSIPDIHSQINKQKVKEIIKLVYNKLQLAKTFHEIFVRSLLPSIRVFTLPLNITLKNIYGENWRLSSYNLHINHIHIQALIRNQYIELPLLNINSSNWWLNISGKTNINAHWLFTMTIYSTLNSLSLYGEKIKLIVSRELNDKLRAKFAFYGPVNAKIIFYMYLTKPNSPLILTFSSPSLQLPLIGIQQYQVRDVTLHFVSQGLNYWFMLKTSFISKKLPLVGIIMNAKGNENSLKLIHLHITALQGDINLRATIDWQDTIKWQSELLFSSINMLSQLSDWPILIKGGKIISCGSFCSNNWQLNIPELNLHGYVNKNIFFAQGSLRGNAAGHWTIPQLQLTIGDNKFIIKGILNNFFMLDALIDAPKLSSILPNLSGRIAGNIKLRGNLKVPKILAHLYAYQLHWQKMSIGYIALKGYIYFSNMIAGIIKLQLQHLQQKAISITQLVIEANGNEKQHQFKLGMQGKLIAGTLNIKGSFNRQYKHWQGTLIKTSFDSILGKWWLTRRISLNYWGVTKKITIGPNCWRNSYVQFCIPHNANFGESGKVYILLKYLEPALLRKILPIQVKTNGIFTGWVSIRWNNYGDLLQGQIILLGKDIKFHQILSGRVLPISVKMIKFNITLNKGMVYLNWFIRITGNGQCNGYVQFSKYQLRHRFYGNIKINNLALDYLKPLFYQSKESIDGFINATIRFNGNIQKPKLYGQLQLKHLSIKGNFMPFNMIKSNFTFSFNGNHFLLYGFINTTHGQVHLVGNAYWNSIKNWKMYINTYGNCIRIIKLPIIRLDTSSNILFIITPSLLIIKGIIDIPWARIEVKNIPQSMVVGISNDEVLLDGNLQPVLDSISSIIPINANLLVHIGPDIRLNAFGLKAKLIGDLKLMRDKQGFRLNGQINIPSGRFHVYGQDLIFNKGELLFSGPINQIYLNIEAILNPYSTEDNMTTGVKITGFIDQPKVEVFPNLIKSAQETFASSLKKEDIVVLNPNNNIMISTLINMGIAQSKKVVDKIGQAFGINDLALDTEGIGDNSQIVVSGYITPGLQVKYSVGIFNSLTTLTLRYRLMPKLYLEAASSFNQTLDLIYNIEF